MASAAFATGLSFVAGYVDTLGFVALAGLFTAHVTGNFVLIGSELVNSSHGMLLKWLAFPAFIVGVLLARWITLATAGSRALLGMQAGLLTLAMLAGTLGRSSGIEAALMTAGILLACGMGVQNGAARLRWSALSPTTVMTGNVTQMVIDLVDAARGAGAPVRSRARKLAATVLAFAVGAVAGAFAYEAWRFLGLLVPLLLLGLLLPLSDSLENGSTR